jgi:hypothetical protein
MKLEFLIAYGSFGSVLIPLVIAILHFNKISGDLKPLCLVLLISLASDLISLIFIQFSLNTYFILNIYLVAQFSLLAWTFRNQLPDHRVADIIIIVFIIFCLVNITLFQGPWIFNSVSNVIACLILIVLCLFYFYRLMNDLPIVHVQHLPMFWIAFGVLTYYAGNFFLFLVKNYLMYGESGSHRLMWILHNLLNITKNLLFAIALWQSYRRVRSSISSS